MKYISYFGDEQPTCHQHRYWPSFLFVTDCQYVKIIQTFPVDSYHPSHIQKLRSICFFVTNIHVFLSVLLYTFKANCVIVLWYIGVKKYFNVLLFITVCVMWVLWIFICNTDIRVYFIVISPVKHVHACVRHFWPRHAIMSLSCASNNVSLLQSKY